MKVSNVHLIVGSGPLFGRCKDGSNCLSAGNEKSKVSTRLIGSKIWNTTSSVVYDGEGIVGCSVCNCTNHLSGTAIGGLNHGGSILSHNTSFTICHTPFSPNEDADTRHNQHFATQSTPSNTTTLNHVFTLCTFKQCTVPGQGGAINSYDDNIDLLIKHCSFHACSGYGGGAVYVKSPSAHQVSFSLSSSSFVACSGVDAGGSVCLHNLSEISISECVFLDSEVISYGAAVFIIRCPFGDSPGLSNTLFQNCQQTSASSNRGGGAIRLSECPTHRFTFLQFRQCSSANGYGHDIYLTDTPFDTDSFSTCDSTSSDTHRVTDYASATYTNNSTLLVTAKYTATVKSLTSTQTGDDTVTFTLTLDKAVSGTMIAIVSNLEGTRQEVAGKAPKIGRVLVFSFSAESTFGTCSSSFGESGLLQLPLSEYTLLAASLSNHSVTAHATFNISVVSPTLLVATCDLDASGTEVKVTFSGIGIPKGLCQLTLNESITLDLPFSDDEFGRSVGTITTGVSGKGGELSEKTKYALTGIVSQAKPTASIEIASGVAITVPEAARLSDVSLSGFVDDIMTTVKLSFDSMRLEANKKYILKMKRTASTEDTITREVLTDAYGVLMDVFEVLFPIRTEAEGRKEQLEFGESYSVMSLTASGCVRSVLISTCTFEMPIEPSRITSCTEAVLNKDRSVVTITLKGRVLGDPLGSVWVSFEGTFWKSSSMRRNSETHCEADFVVASTQNETHLTYEKKYTFCMKPDEPNTLLVDSGISVRVPVPPRLTSLESVFVNSLQTLCKIKVRGTHFDVGTEHEVTLNNAVRIEVQFTTSTEGESEEVSVGKNGKLKHNTTYTLTEVTPTREEDGLILLSGTILLTTPKLALIEVLVREGGSEKVEECGSIGNPCSSVFFGWRVAEEGGVESIVVKIDGSGGFGGRLVVGEKSLEIAGLFERANELKVESGDSGKAGEEGVVSVSGGRVLVVGVQLSLPSGWEMGEKSVGSVLFGFGECIVREVSIVSGWKGEAVEMALVCWLGGSLSLEKIVMEGVEMESGRVLVNCSSSKKEVSFEMAESRFIEVGTRNAELVHFSSKSKDSNFEMRDCVFLSTERVESGEVGDGMGVIVVSTWQEKTEIRKCLFSNCGTVIVVSTWQEKTEIRKCLFSNCGTVIGSRGSEKKGGVLIVMIGSSTVGERKEVGLLGNVFVDSSVSWEGDEVAKRGGVSVWTVGECQTNIDLSGSWFEETGVSGVKLDRDRFGVPVLEEKRKIAHCLSGCGSIGLVVVRGRTVPVIRRVGSSFSGCSLRMVSDEAEQLMDQNKDEL